MIVFSIGLSNPSQLPLHYQWFRNGDPIAEANGPTYTLQPTIAADNGATFSVRAAKAGSTVTSRVATLNVVPDVTGPRVLSLTSSYTNLSRVVVRYSEFVNETAAEDPFSYELGQPSIVAVGVLAPDGRTVTVELGEALVLGQTYQISIDGISDLAGLPLDPSPTVITFVAGADAPRLSISLSGNNAVLSWPASLSGFVVEETGQIVEPASAIVWAATGGTPQVIEGRNTLTVALGPTPRFFRLRR